MRKPAAPAIDPAPIVYVIDDDPSVRAALEDLLASMGLQVRAFASTQAFLEHDLEDAPACLVLDVRMPGQSGLEFHRTMGSHGLQLPVVFITGHGDIAMGVNAIKDGAIEFLTKPFRDQELLDAIHKGSRSTASAAATARHSARCNCAGTPSTPASARWLTAWYAAASTSRLPATSGSARSR